MRSLDGVRAVAVVLVFAHHVSQAAMPGGWLGVELFFALSGFLITSLLLREWSREGRIRLRAFWVRRALRLGPALLLLVAVLLPIALVLHSGVPLLDAAAALLSATNIYSVLGRGNTGLWAHTWSLSVEEQFYLVWPLLLVVGLGRRWRPGLLVGAVAACGLLIGAGIAVVSPAAAYRLPFAHVPVLLAGVGLAFAVHHRRPWLGRLGSPLVPVAVGLGLLGGLFVVDQRWPWLYWGGLAMIAVALVALPAHLVVAPGGPAARVLSLPPLVWLGERSYGFYLWHYPILYVALRALHDEWLAAAVGLPLTLVATQVSWLVVERPALRLKRRFQNRHVAVAS